MNYFKSILLLWVLIIKYNLCLTPISLDKTYEKGVKAYTDERWSRCIEKFEESLHLYKLLKSVVMNCRLKCASKVYESYVKQDIEDLKIYETYFNRRNCINQCQDIGFRAINLKSIPEEYVLSKMHARKPYEYLHMCYFQMHMFQKAASAAYTYFLAHPDDNVMKGNIQYYLDQPEVDTTEVMDLEGDDYVILYNLGINSYFKKNWAETVASMEEAIKNYIASENQCRVECEHQPGQEWSSEFVITLSNNMASLLHCHQLCQDKLSLLKYHSGVEFLTDILNHLQMSYYHLEKLEDAVEAVKTYLILKPNDEDMLANEKFYGDLVEKKIESQRSDVTGYFARDKYEKELLNLFHKDSKHNVNAA
ncbi:unnamed protein product [Arctia plantaginis]|uniref:Leprecan-like alpha-helical domain-containing protein n=1 Tax=Arctia plantaginis TaxID=874455 RepID=A0A8S1A1I6_ARCPL|nr:unnamed protein product [Arctia plantaginis]